jgi:hypothetical protein
MERPAETGAGVAAAIATLLVLFFDLQEEVLAPLIIVVGAIPGLISWLVDRKG